MKRTEEREAAEKISQRRGPVIEASEEVQRGGAGTENRRRWKRRKCLTGMVSTVAPGQHKGKAQAPELRKNDMLMHQTEVASLLSHQMLSVSKAPNREGTICKRASIEERP